MQFKDIVGQKDLVSKILHLVQQDHLPHAIMILGQDGSGGLPISLALAQYIVCLDRNETDSCGTCSACTKMNKLQHPDVHFSFPVIKKDDTIANSDEWIREFREFAIAQPYGNDIDWMEQMDAKKQGNITAWECRKIIQKLQLRSYESEFKVMIMWYPEYLGKEGNILLKLIEEPTAKTIMIFVTENIDDVLQTIQSRTQLFPLKKLQELEIKNALSNSGVEASRALQIAKLADGNYNYAQKLIHSAEDDLLGLSKKLLNCIYANRGLELVEWVMEIAEKNKETQKKFLNYFIQLLEHKIRFEQIGSSSLALMEEEQKIIEILIAKSLSAHSIGKISEMIDDSIYQIERNANTKILFHALSLRIQQVILRQKVMA